MHAKQDAALVGRKLTGSRQLEPVLFPQFRTLS